MAAEGTIQFAYNLTERSTPLPDYAELAAWRTIFFRLDLIGQHPDRYDGFGYGNMSAKLSDDDSFVITASQTSGEEKLSAEQLVTVAEVNLGRFWVEAQGSEPPSSETLTHAMIYAADQRVRTVFHIHCSEIWLHRDALNLPETPASVAYGSPDMVTAVADLLEEHQSRPLVFATAGHTDGIFALSTHARDCGGLLMAYYAKALALANADD